MSVQAGTHPSFHFHVTEDNEPSSKHRAHKRPRILEVFGHRVPVLISNVNTKLIMDQENDDGSGKFFNHRVPAYDRDRFQWSMLYETKNLLLMSDPEKYIKMWPKTTLPKHKIHVLETSLSLVRNEPMVLESMQITSDNKARFKTFAVPSNKYFGTNMLNGYHLLRQSSNEQHTTNDYFVDCRFIAKRNQQGMWQQLGDIEMVFIVYLKSIEINLKDVIDKAEYVRLQKLEHVLLFKQIGETEP